MSDEPPHTAGATSEVRLATYNVHHWVGRGGKADPERAMAVLADIDPHVAALQEVITPDAETLQALVDRTLPGMQTIFGPTMFKQEARYGNVLLTRLPILRKKLHNLSRSGREPRGAIEVQLRTPSGGSLCVVATHLGLAGGERRKQVHALLDLLPHCQSDSLAFMGDCNIWFPWSPTLRLLHEQFGAGGSRPTFPARWPLLHLDRIWVHPQERLQWLRAHATPAAHAASDHLPLAAGARLP